MSFILSLIVFWKEFPTRKVVADLEKRPLVNIHIFLHFFPYFTALYIKNFDFGFGGGEYVPFRSATAEKRYFHAPFSCFILIFAYLKIEMGY